MTAMRLKRYPSSSGGIALGKMGVGATLLKQGKTARDYVQNGLIAMWDGVENAGWGVHDPNATTWKDLIGSNDMTCEYSFNDNSVVLTGYKRCYANTTNLTTSDIITIEAAVNVGTAYTNMMYARFVNDTRIIALAIASRGGISLWTGKMGFGSLSTGFKSMSIVYGSDDVASFTMNGEAIERQTASDGWNTPGKAIFIGSKDGANAKGFVGNWYSLRIYSRALTAEEIAANYAIDKERFNLP